MAELSRILPGVLALALLAGLPMPARAQSKGDAVFAAMAARDPPPAGARFVRQGSAFFIGPATLLTAAHLVGGCARIDVLAPRPWVARVLRVDAAADLAVLAVAGAAPAWLPVAHAAPVRDVPVQMLGFPDTDHGDAPATNPGVLVNQAAAALRDGAPPAGQRLLLRAAIRHGSSGGPVLDETGAVIGLVQGFMPDTQQIQAAYGLAESNLATGPGLAVLRNLLGEWPQMPAPPGPPEAAMVRLLCWVRS